MEISSLESSGDITRFSKRYRNPSPPIIEPILISDRKSILRTGSEVSTNSVSRFLPPSSPVSTVRGVTDYSPPSRSLPSVCEEEEISIIGKIVINSQNSFYSRFSNEIAEIVGDLDLIDRRESRVVCMQIYMLHAFAGTIQIEND